MADPVLTSRDINKLTNTLEKLITTIGKGNLSGDSKGGTTSKTEVESAQKMGKLLTKKLQDNKKYLDILLKIDKNSEDILKTGYEEKKLQDAELIYLKKVSDLNILLENKSRTRTKLHQDQIKQLKIETENALLNLDTLKTEVELEKEKAKIIADTAAENAKAIAKEENLEKSRQKRKETVDNIRKATGKFLLKQAGDALDIMLDSDSAISKLSANYSLSKTESGELKKNIGEIAWRTQLIGVGTGDLVKLQTSYTDQMGRSVMLGKENMVSMANTSVALGLGVEATGQMAADMNLFGSGVADSMDTLQSMVDLSKKSGVSASVAAKNFESNLKLANTYNFKNGIDGVKEMTVYATQMGIKLESVASFADKISTPEGALKTAAALQVLGGSFSQMADPLKLMNQGITDMGGLTETYSKMLDGVVSIDKVTHKMNENGYEKIRIKAASEAAGISFDDMMTAARTKAQRGAIQHDVSLNTNIKTEDQKNLLATLATFDSKKGGYSVNVNGTQKTITTLDSKDLAYLKPEPQHIADIAENTLGIKEIIDNGIKSLLTAIVGQLLPAVNLVAKYILDAFHYLMPSVDSGAKGISTVANSSMGGKVLGDVGQIGGKIMARNGIKSLAKLGLGTAGRAIPYAGGLIDAGFAANDFINGNYRSMGMNLAAGAANFIPGIGPVAGLAINGLNAGMDVYGASHPGSMFDSARDVLIPSGGGRPIKLDTKDDVYAMKPGGAIQQSIMPRNETSSIFSGVSPSYNNNSNSGSNNSSNNNHIPTLNHTGAITLNMAGGGSSRVDASELMRNPQFVREMSRIISQINNRDDNGGGYSGPLGPDSF